STLGPFPVNPAGTEISRIAVDFVFVHGLYEINKKGKLDDETRELTAEYQEIDDNGDPVGNWIELFSKEFKMRTRTPQRITREVKVTPGRYQVRFSGDADLTDTEDPEGKTRVNRAAWVGLRGFVHDWTTPSGVTLIATKIRATEQISSQSAGQYFFTAARTLPAH